MYLINDNDGNNGYITLGTIDRLIDNLGKIAKWTSLESTTRAHTGL